MKESVVVTEYTDKPSHRPQYFATFCASMGALTAGTVIGYASPASYQLRGFELGENGTASSSLRPYLLGASNSSENRDWSDLNYYNYNLSRSLAGGLNPTLTSGDLEDGGALKLNPVELSWFSASLNIGALLGSLLASPMLNLMGRKGAMITSTIPCLLGWLLLACGSNVLMLVTGRILTGMFTGMMCVAVNTYVGEIASSDIRGRLGISFQMMTNFGIAYAYTVGSFCTWYTLAFLCCIPTVIFAFLMFFVKESPLHLLAKGKKEEAAEALQFYRGKHYNVSKELDDLERARKEVADTKITWSELKQPYLLRPILIVVALMVFQQISGINAFIFNIETLLRRTNSPIPEEYSTIMSGAVLSASDFLSAVVIDIAGRRRLLIISAIVMTATQSIIGFFFFYLERVDEAFAAQYLSWLPVLAVMVFLVAFSVGFGAVPWVMMGEVLPPNVRETAGAIASATNWAVSFAVTFSFESLQVVLHTYGYFWLFAAFNVAGGLFATVYVVETKGKTLQEISAMFAGHDKGLP